MGVEERNIVDGEVVLLLARVVWSVAERVRKGRVACGRGLRQVLD